MINEYWSEPNCLVHDFLIKILAKNEPIKSGSNEVHDCKYSKKEEWYVSPKSFLNFCNNNILNNHLQFFKCYIK